MSDKPIIAHCDACNDDFPVGTTIARTEKDTCYVLKNKSFPDGIKLHVKDKVRVEDNALIMTVPLSTSSALWAPPKRFRDA